jgi:hypothetical protein
MELVSLYNHADSSNYSLTTTIIHHDKTTHITAQGGHGPSHVGRFLGTSQ